MINDQGGIAGRMISASSTTTTAFNRPKRSSRSVALWRTTNVAILFSMLGTAPNSAVVNYINQRKVPHLFLSVNGDKWGNYKMYPWTMPFAPSARIEIADLHKVRPAAEPERRSSRFSTRTTIWRRGLRGGRPRCSGAPISTRYEAFPYQP